MTGNSKNKLKLLYLMKIFLEETDEEHPLTMSQLQERLRAQDILSERRSVYGDIQLLRDFGLDIVGEKRKQYVYYLAGRDFELAELKLLADTVSSARFITLKKSQQLIKKIEGLTSRHYAGELRRQVFVSGRVKTFNEGIYYNVDAIHRAIGLDCQVSFKYYDYDLDKKQVFRRQGIRYRVSPYILCWDNDNYYLVAWHSRYDKLAHFRVDKMADIRVEEADRRQFLDKSIDAVEYCQKTFGMFAGRDSWVKVRFAGELIGVVVDRFGKDVSVTRDGEDHFIASIKVSVSPVFYSWLLQFGDRVEILGPEEVRRDMAGQLRDILANYEDGRES